MQTNGNTGAVSGGDDAMPTTMPSRDQVNGREPVTDADQLPIHPGDDDGLPQDRSGYVAQERQAARHRRTRGVPQSDALVFAMFRRRLLIEDPTPGGMFTVLTPADVAQVAAAVEGQGVRGVQA